MNQAIPHSRNSRTAQWLLAALLIAAPLFHSGKTPLAALLLELLALSGLALLLWQPLRLLRSLSPWERGFFAVLIALPVVQLLPLPVSRLALPGQADYYTVLGLVGSDAVTRLSILPDETWTGLLILLVPVAVYLLSRTLHRDQLTTLMHLTLGLAALQAVLGLAQFGAGPDSALYALTNAPSNSAQGTYTSRNNFVGFMYLAFMVSLAMFMATLGKERKDHAKRSLRERLVYLSTGQGHRAFVYGVLAVLFLLAVIFSRSRAGIAVTILGLVLAATAYSRRIGGDNVYGLTGTVVAVVGTVALAIGLAPVLERFAALDSVENGRGIIFRGAIEGIGQFFPLGSGVGTFPDVFPPFQSLEQAGFTINRAHNSYLEWVFAGGVVAMLLIAAGLALFALRWLRVYRAGAWGEFRFMQVGAGLGLALMLIHDLVDYNLFVPANMVFFAFFAGVFWHPYEEPVRRPKTRKSPTESVRQRTVLPPVTEHAPNPFDEPEDSPAEEPDTAAPPVPVAVDAQGPGGGSGTKGRDEPGDSRGVDVTSQEAAGERNAARPEPGSSIGQTPRPKAESPEAGDTPGSAPQAPPSARAAPAAEAAPASGSSVDENEDPWER